MPETLKQKITVGIANKTQRQALGAAMRRGREGRAIALQTLDDPESFVSHVRKIKEQSIDNLDNLSQEFVRNASRRGAKVFLANNGASAVHYVAEVAKLNDAKLIAKSKSLTSEEIDLNHPLEEMGYQVVETDLGERIIQLAHEKPIHLVFPAAHKTVQQVADLFSKEGKATIPADYDAIMDFVRASLRNAFLQADIGITGGNIAIAETGTIVIETNEGNARLVSSIPNVQIAIVGIEKIVPTIEDAIEMLQAHPIAASGQKLTTYVSFISGRSPLQGRDGRRELHIVLLDNGRSVMRRHEDFREALFCIRCGACMNICPTYEVVGGHVFGHIYPGPIGIPWTASVHGLEKAEFASLCIACGLCHEICPAGIDIPYLIAKVKELNVERSGQIFANRIVMRSDEFAEFASLTAPFSNWILRRRTVRHLMEKFMGIDKRRRLPAFSRHTFQRWWHDHKPSVESSQHRVAYFVDVYANYNRPDIGIGAVRLLERAGVKVEVPKQKASGMPYFSYGELEEARKVAAFNVASMLPLARAGCKILATEPTATYCFKELYPKLLKTEESRLVADHTSEFLDYVQGVLGQGPIRDSLRGVFSGRAGFHISCHQRALTKSPAALDLMRLIGLDVKVIETGTCCGMGGTFGLKAGPLGYELSTEVARPLLDLFNREGIEFGLAESSVCTMQLEQGTNLRFEHPVALLAAAMDGRRDYMAYRRKEHSENS